MPLQRVQQPKGGLISLARAVQERAQAEPERVAFILAADDAESEKRLTYRELDLRARAIAMELGTLGTQGERVLLLCPPGLAYVEAFLSCLYAGVIAVPAFPPGNRRSLPRIIAIANDCGATIALSTRAAVARFGRQPRPEDEPLRKLRWLVVDEFDETARVSDFVPKLVRDTDLALLQYTSGSTKQPKGVMVSHANIMHNSAVIAQNFRCTADSIGAIWLPPYHDMGLIGGIIQPLYSGFPCVLMSPAAFLSKPFRWLETISRHKVTISGGPNFAYDLCVMRIDNTQREQLDLSSWCVAFNGAEPIRASTIQRFAEAFHSCGFDQRAMHPCYGLAESTLMVTGAVPFESPHVIEVCPNKLRVNAIELSCEVSRVALVGSGYSCPTQQLCIVDPDTRRRLVSTEIGEIWISSPSIAQGYWGKEEESRAVFGAV